MPTFKRVHNSGTEATLNRSPDGWSIRLDLREVNHRPVTIVGSLVQTAEEAKLLADTEILKHGHTCTLSCEDWFED